MIIYLVGVALMAITIIYLDYTLLPKLAKYWQFWFAFSLLCLLSWAGIVMVILFTLKHDFSKDKYNEEEQG